MNERSGDLSKYFLVKSFNESVDHVSKTYRHKKLLFDLFLFVYIPIEVLKERQNFHIWRTVPLTLNYWKPVVLRHFKGTNDIS